jgi:hypothetical protein
MSTDREPPSWKVIGIVFVCVVLYSPLGIFIYSNVAAGPWSRAKTLIGAIYFFISVIVLGFISSKVFPRQR